MTDNKILMESLAKIIYEKAMLFDRQTPHYDWVEGGNSQAQDVARSTAYHIIAEICERNNIYNAKKELHNDQ